MTPNKTVFITGASRGIGRAIAIRFAAAGYQLALCCRQNTQLLEDLQQLIISQYHTDCLIFTGDTGDYHQLEAMISETIARFHHIDVLVNNAGISYIGLLTDMSPDDWQRIVNTNLTSVLTAADWPYRVWFMNIPARSSIFLPYGAAAAHPVKWLIPQQKAASMPSPRPWPKSWPQAIFRSMPLPAEPLIPK